MVEPSFAKRCVVNHNDYFRNGRIIISYAVNITDNSVFIADGNQITYDYLVVALGHNAYVPKTMSERLKKLSSLLFSPRYGHGNIIFNLKALQYHSSEVDHGEKNTMERKKERD
ncbi:hypothetical protein Syun_021627 [Stephania yunnanensis]|uniref:Uncharacterized protein n=1 Tax=Stephania yunnanensis TaxID=152371 RepID=A0AAP0IGE7_9MAGN